MVEDTRVPIKNPNLLEITEKVLSHTQVSCGMDFPLFNFLFTYIFNKMSLLFHLFFPLFNVFMVTYPTQSYCNRGLHVSDLDKSTVMLYRTHLIITGLSLR